MHVLTLYALDPFLKCCIMLSIHHNSSGAIHIHMPSLHSENHLKYFLALLYPIFAHNLVYFPVSSL